MSRRIASLLLMLGAVHVDALPSETANRLSAQIDTILITGNIRTRTEIVRRELLFAAGDRLDTNLVAESARKLRALPFLGDARVRVRREGDAAVVHVEVEDLYSRALSPQFAGDLDELSYGLIGLDYNFLGRGQTAEITVHHDAVTLRPHAIRPLRGDDIACEESFGEVHPLLHSEMLTGFEDEEPVPGGVVPREFSRSIPETGAEASGQLCDGAVDAV